MCRPVRPRSGLLSRRALLGPGSAALASLAVPLRRRAGAETPVADSLAELERRTRDYEEALAKLIALEEQAADRAKTAAARARALHREGLVALRDVETAEQAEAAARDRLDETRSQLAESRRILVEAQALGRLAALPPTTVPGGERSTPEVAEYRGATPWSLAQVASLARFFTERFGRSLPVSALGQTPTHDRLGFDHRNAVDVAVHPDSVEGRALLDHLRARGIPYLAFRGSLAGTATGAHVHVGAASPRLG